MSTRQCKASVHHGRMGLFPCQKTPGPSGYCGVHDKEAKAKAREALTRPALRPAAVATELRVKVTFTARVAWSTGTGPRTVVPYTEKIVELERVTVSRDLGETMGEWSRVQVAAVRVKKDGTLGAMDDGRDNWRWGALPEEVRETLTAALDAKEAAYRA